MREVVLTNNIFFLFFIIKQRGATNMIFSSRTNSALFFCLIFFLIPTFSLSRSLAVFHYILRSILFTRRDWTEQGRGKGISSAILIRMSFYIINIDWAVSLFYTIIPCLYSWDHMKKIHIQSNRKWYNTMINQYFLAIVWWHVYKSWFFFSCPNRIYF